MNRLKVILGYSAAGLTVLASVLTPFLLMNLFSRGVGATGVRIDPVYSGGDKAYTIARPGYQIVVNRPVLETGLLRRNKPFVQLTWKPAAALPVRVSEEIDLDGDSKPDVAVTFDVPKFPQAELRVDGKPLTPLALPMVNVGKDSFSSVIVRVGETIVVRVPIRDPR
jgi:hypothetical protein